MNTPNSAIKIQSCYKSEKLKFYNWVLKWACSKNAESEDVAIDIPVIASVLQVMGFKLETFEKFAAGDQKQDDNEVKIELFCGKSGMRAILTKQDMACTCPSAAKEIEGKFWVVSGAGPSSSQDYINKINETYSTLLPTLSKESSLLIKDVLCKLFSIVAETDVNQNNENHTNSPHLLERVRSLDDLSGKNEPSKVPLIRQSTWEVDPKISPPTRTSSPLPELCKSIDQISLNADKDQMLVEILHSIKESVEKALVLLPSKNNTFTKTNAKRLSNIKVSPTVVTPTRSTTGKSTPDLPVRKTPAKLNLRIQQTPKKSGSEKRQLLVPSKIGSFRKKAEGLTPTSDRPKLIKKDSPWPAGPLGASPNTAGNSEPRRQITLPSKSSLLRNSNSNIASVGSIPSTSALKPRTGIPAFGTKQKTPSNKPK